MSISTNPAAAIPPEGVTPNFENPPNGRVPADAVLSLFIIFSTTAVCTRIYTRWIAQHQFSIGDMVFLVSYALWITTIALLFHANCTIGLFVHQYDLHLLDLVEWFYDIFLIRDVFLVFVPTIKVAILLEWIRIFSPVGARDFVFWTCHSVLWLNIAFYIVTLVFANRGCDIQEVRRTKIISPDCIYTWTSWNGPAAAAFNAATDLAIMVIPQRAIWKLNLSSTKKKFGVAVVFAIGIMGTVAAIIRLAITFIGLKATDGTYTFSFVMMACLAEGLCAFLVISGPTAPRAYSSFQTWLGSTMSKISIISSSKNSDSTSGSSRSKAYLNIDRHHPVPLEKTDSASSAEYLREQHDRGTGIIRSTQFGVSEWKATGDDLERQARR